MLWPVSIVYVACRFADRRRRRRPLSARRLGVWFELSVLAEPACELAASADGSQALFRGFPHFWSGDQEQHQRW
ncbi:hypothetical protein [Streptomyces sp. NPDC020681]|uniref:hypothetical protein n=1 Tax=Streptomyces sp. NPDC020681 TaxID=3365083 RepID=UPI00378B3FD2